MNPLLNQTFTLRLAISQSVDLYAIKLIRDFLNDNELEDDARNPLLAYQKHLAIQIDKFDELLRSRPNENLRINRIILKAEAFLQKRLSKLEDDRPQAADPLSKLGLDLEELSYLRRGRLYPRIAVLFADTKAEQANYDEFARSESLEWSKVCRVFPSVRTSENLDREREKTANNEITMVPTWDRVRSH